MAKKKQGKAKAKAPTKKQKLQQEKTTYFLIGIGFIVFGIIGGLKLGFLGILMANVFRFLVGNTFRVMSVLLVIYGVLLLFMGKDPKFKRKTIWIGGLIFYLGVLLFIEIGLFKQINRDTAIISLTWQKIYAEIKTNQISQSVGGGMIGATLYSVTYFLVSKFGSYVISFIAMGSGALLFLNIGLNDVIEKIRTWGGSAAESMDEKKQQLSERQEEKKKLKTQKEKKKLSENSVRELSPGEKLAQESQDAPIEVEQEQMTLEIDSYQDSYNKEQISRSKKATEKPAIIHAINAIANAPNTIEKVFKIFLDLVIPP